MRAGRGRALPASLPAACRRPCREARSRRRSLRRRVSTRCPGNPRQTCPGRSCRGRRRNRSRRRARHRSTSPGPGHAPAWWHGRRWLQRRRLRRRWSLRVFDMGMVLFHTLIGILTPRDATASFKPVKEITFHSRARVPRGRYTLKQHEFVHCFRAVFDSATQWRHAAGRPGSYRRSGGTPSARRVSTISSNPAVCVCFSPRRRTLTDRSSTSRWPMARITGTLPTECSRTL